jgi:hypothetical protein
MLILLDIDGVMIPAASWKPVLILDDDFPQFSIKAVSNLNQILNETGASIVLTTSHKSRFSLAEWGSIFKTRGIDVKIQKLDDNIDNLDRKGEVLNWIDKNRNYEEEYIIIDDDKTLNDLPAEIKERLVLTKPLIGINQEDAASAIYMLKSRSLVTA